LRSAAILFVLTAVLRAQSVSPAPPEPAERIEAGRAHLPNGTEIIYRIRLLPLASFPALPMPIADQLRQKNCMVPQTYEARRPENVIRGAFEKQGSEDWAALCSINGTTTLYVFFQSRPNEPAVLRRQHNTEWLGAEVVGAYGSAWGISALRPSQVRAAEPGNNPGPIDHDGIDDAFVERSSSIHYFRNGEWSTLGAAN
jgi:hypothetical protein